GRTDQFGPAGLPGKKGANELVLHPRLAKILVLQSISSGVSVMRKMLCVLLVLPLVGFAGCGSPPNPWDGVPGGPTRVLLSCPPLYCFAKQVAGPHAAVLCLATTVGPHHYEPTREGALKPN